MALVVMSQVPTSPRNMRGRSLRDSRRCRVASLRSRATWPGLPQPADQPRASMITAEFKLRNH
jgi:hypothetical protein